MNIKRYTSTVFNIYLGKFPGLEDYEFSNEMLRVAWVYKFSAILNSIDT